MEVVDKTRFCSLLLAFTSIMGEQALLAVLKQDVVMRMQVQYNVKITDIMFVLPYTLSL